MGDNLRRQVLHIYKKLHRTRMNIFKDDEYALEVTRNKINEEYKKYKNVTNSTAIEELNKYAEEVEHEIRTTVIQAVEEEPGKFELRITPDTLVDNAPYPDTEKQNRSSSKKKKDLNASVPKDEGKK